MSRVNLWEWLAEIEVKLAFVQEPEFHLEKLTSAAF